MQVFIYAMLQIYQFHLNSLVEIVSFCSALLVICAYMIFSLWLTKADITPSTYLIMIDKPREIFSLIKFDQKAFVLVPIVRKFLMSGVLVFLQKYPKVQLVCLTVMSLANAMLLIHFQPYKKKKQNILKIVGEIFFCIAHMILLMFPILESRLEA